MLTSVNINLDNIQEIGLAGIRRACLFMGFGINSAIDPNFKNFRLDQKSLYQLVPDQVSTEQLQDFKTEYYNWTIRCALRELVESYEIFIDNIFKAAFVIDQQYAQEYNEQLFQKQFDQFHLKKFFSKLQEIRDYGVLIPHSEAILSIKNVRNCIGHRLGRVSNLDLKSPLDLKEGKLITMWTGFDFFLEDITTGSQIYLTERGEFLGKGATTLNPSNVMMKTSVRKKGFCIGQIVSFSPSELHEMCLTISLSITETVASVLKLYNERTKSLVSTT